MSNTLHPTQKDHYVPPSQQHRLNAGKNRFRRSRNVAKSPLAGIWILVWADNMVFQCQEKNDLELFLPTCK